MVKNNNNNNLKVHCLSLNNIALISLLDSSIVLAVTDISIKNRVVMSITHIHYWDCSIMKTIHHAINVMSMEAELFAISVVATTRRNGTCEMLTSAKLSVGYLVVGIYKKTQQRALAALLLYLYKLHVVRATTISTCPNVHALSSCPITHLL